MVSQLVLAGLLLIVVWLAIITFFLWRLLKNYRVFTQGANRKSLDIVLSNIIKELDLLKKDIAKLSERCDTIENDGRYHIQKIGLLRFNPFKDTGGDQSFILALLDAKETGVVITALYSRSGTRWYAKKVVQGKGFEHELSEEEKKALKIATSITKQ